MAPEETIRSFRGRCRDMHPSISYLVILYYLFRINISLKTTNVTFEEDPRDQSVMHCDP